MDDRKIVAWGEGHNSWVMVSSAINFLNVPWQTCSLRTGYFYSVGRLVELLLIHIGPHQVLMEMEKMSIALVLLVRYAKLNIAQNLCIVIM